MSRRTFLKQLTLGTAGLALAPTLATAKPKQNNVKLTILHTNDMHSRIEPFPVSDKKYGGRGGFARIHSLVNRIRQQESNVLLLDSGDVFQGTPYFNMFGGELEYKLMSKMGYDAGTIGNHEFDNGMDNILKQMKHLNFPLVSANYDFSKTVLANKIPEYTIVKRAGKRIGVFGLGVALKGLVDKGSYGKTVYNDPVIVTNRVAKHLKEVEKCDLVICLSHIGYSYDNSRISDVTLVKQIQNVDIILGGHTHTFLEQAEKHTDASGREVLINQVGWAGIALGRIDYYI
ncbi:5'-nucleotidase [Balneicella halophila]|uniref:5'-nucleotidase n=1 Tax=Balneicella halophila TaxID=1537566 RepID=A0A7L4UMP2_BALHA|nr:metallophosphatase [Balneicella halophila]PVX49894.1 5'-nucleotidase [Balneicella halophila]